MCLTPNNINGIPVGCRLCWQCRKRRVSDLVGRCIAESKTSNKTFAITLTYAPSAGVSAVTLVYKDLQNFMKRLRKRYNVRYFCAGEYGSKKGRAHWHIILFFKDDLPDVQTNTRFLWDYWPHGLSYFQAPDWKGFEYVCKYVLKQLDQRSNQAHFGMSKKPPLGAQYFDELVQEYIDQKMVPQDYFYKFRDIRDNKNRVKSFLLSGKTKENFISSFYEKWVDKFNTIPKSPIIDEYLDKITEIEYTDEELIKRLSDRSVRYIEGPMSDLPDIDATIIQAEYQGIEFLYVDKDGLQTITTEVESWPVDEIQKNRIISQSKIIKSWSLSQFLWEEQLP